MVWIKLTSFTASVEPNFFVNFDENLSDDLYERDIINLIIRFLLRRKGRSKRNINEIDNGAQIVDFKMTILEKLPTFSFVVLNTQL